MQERLRATLAGQTVLVLVLLALTVLFSISLDRFFTVATLRAVLNQIPAITVVSIGMTFVLITGAIDLSVGSVLALTSACLGLLMARHQWNLPAAAAAVLIVGILSGVVSGSLITFARLPSFIVTLGVLQATRGLALLATGSRPQYIGARVEWLSSPSPALGSHPHFWPLPASWALHISCSLRQFLDAGAGHWVTMLWHSPSVVSTFAPFDWPSSFSADSARLPAGLSKHRA